MASPAMQKHELMDGELIVYLKEITFLDMQQAAQALIAASGGLDLADYWRYAFANWVDSTEPEMATEELVRLRPDVGKALSELLPAPEELGGMLGFSKPQPTSSTTMHTGDQSHKRNG